MKLRVIGWTYYGDDLPQGKNGWAARSAIVDEIKKQGYLFSGASHQDCDYCVPVCNDGKMYRFSQRSWGDVMAEAHGYTGRMDYVKFAFARSIDYYSEIHPKEQYDEDTFITEGNLNERFEIEVSPNVFASAQHSHEISLDDLPTLRYLDVGDTLALTCELKTVEYIVTNVDRTKDLTEERRRELELAIRNVSDEKRMKRAIDEFDSAKTIMIVKLS